MILYADTMTRSLRAAAADLEFEQAARLRDEIKRLEALELGLERSRSRYAFTIWLEGKLDASTRFAVPGHVAR